MKNVFQNQLEIQFKLKLNREMIINIMRQESPMFTGIQADKYCVSVEKHFDLKWIVLDSEKVKKIFKWKVKFSKYNIFQDINLNDH